LHQAERPFGRHRGRVEPRLDRNDGLDQRGIERLQAGVSLDQRQQALEVRVVDGPLVNGRPAECLVAHRCGALARVRGVQRTAALEKKPVPRIDWFGGEMRNTLVVDIPP
jgi:hypothetical protein